MVRTFALSLIQASCILKVFKWAIHILFSLYFCLFKQPIQFFSANIGKWINVEPVYGAGIRTRDLLNMSLLPSPLDQDSRPTVLLSYNRQFFFYLWRMQWSAPHSRIKLLKILVIQTQSSANFSRAILLRYKHRLL